MIFKKFRPYLSENAALYAALFVFNHYTTSINSSPSLTSMHWTHPFRILSYDRSTASLKSEFSTEYILMFPLSIYSILPFPKDRPVSAYVSFLVLPLLLSFLLHFLQ